MKFLCVDCNEAMVFSERQEPGDGTFAVEFTCPKCGRAIALLANPMETQLVGALGVKIGGRTLEQPPLEFVRGKMIGRDDAFVEDQSGISSQQSVGEKPGPGGAGPPAWSVEARARLERVPGFVRGMVKKIYTDYAVERRIPEITPAVMDQARAELGLEGM